MSCATSLRETRALHPLSLSHQRMRFKGIAKVELVFCGVGFDFGLFGCRGDVEAAKWKEAIKSEIQSMYDNQVWNLVDTTPSLNTVGYGCQDRFKLTEDVFMAQLEGFENAKYPKRVCKLQKAIYGLKQASRSWNLYFHEKFTQFGFSRSEDESCIYFKVSRSVIVFLVLYVNDILLIGNDIPTLQSVKGWLGKCFAMKDLGDASYILGIKIYRDRLKCLIGLSQDTYLDKILKRFKMENSRKENLPLHHGIKVSKDLCLKTDEELDKMSRVPYASAIGSIMYAMTYTRPDVSFALSMFLVYGGEEKLRVTSCCDASWQTDKDDSRSLSGWVFLLNRGAVTWKSSKKDTVADSTYESEYIATCRFNLRRISLTEFPAQSVRSSNADALDSPYLLVLITGTSQSRQHGDTILIHLESRKSPTAKLFDVDSGTISIRHYEYYRVSL
ncbi:retrotransposon protein, putative, ty1-copia subclass [Tanacetum coccineum]|uniref:Retrotransposon protein, putative, ty1-copia subclass n=1 Tax=Tanacetum coccineum TaxID=301880 RepID=A0ABQ4YKT2_9ASTR